MSIEAAEQEEPIRGEIVKMPEEEPEGEHTTALERAAEAALAMPGVPGRDEFFMLAAQARILAMSGAAPEAVRNNPHLAFHIAMVGRDLGISPSAALELIDVIDTGKGPRLSLSPQLLNGQIRRVGLGKIVPVEQTMERCVARAIGPDGEVLGETEFSWEEARVAGLVVQGCQPGQHTPKCLDYRTHPRERCNQGYRTYPKRMLWWRACLPERAEALTPKGWVTHEKLSVGDLILGFDQATGLTDWTVVEAVNTFEARQTYTIEHRSFRAVATAGHEWVCDHWKRPGRWEKRRTDELDGHPYRRLLVAAPMADRPSLISAEDAARLGWVITDGTIAWRGASPSITISQSKHVEAVRALFGDRCVEDVLDRPGGFGTARPEHRFRLNATESRRLLGAGGIATKDDAALIPARLDQTGRAAMFEAMVLANGEQFCTGHEAVWDCWTILATMLGHRVGRPARQRGSIRGRINGSRVVSVRHLSTTPDAVEPVWCPTTSLGTWVARIDGQVTITGNSGFCADDFFPEAGLGLYSPEELGSIVDSEGRPLDPATVDVPEGYEPKAPERDEADDQLTPPDVLLDLTQRVEALPDDAKAELKVRWGRFDKLQGIRLAALPASRVGLVTSLLRGVEAQAKAAGWNADEALAAVRAKAAQEAAQTPPVSPETPEPAPEPVQPASAENGPETATEGSEAATEGAQNERAILGVADPELIRAVVDEVKELSIRDVDARLKEHGLDTDGNADTRRMRLSLRIIKERHETQQVVVDAAITAG
jgi:hypothetical protein